MFHFKREDFMFKVRFIARSGGGLGRNIGEVALASKMASMPLRFSMGAWELLTWTVPLEQHLSAQNRRRFIDQDSSDPITEGASYAKSGDSARTPGSAWYRARAQIRFSIAPKPTCDASRSEAKTHRLTAKGLFVRPRISVPAELQN